MNVRPWTHAPSGRGYRVMLEDGSRLFIAIYPSHIEIFNEARQRVYPK
jgi:hypothetical protein